MEEIWKDIKDYEKSYAISNLGNIKNKRTGKILRPYKNTNNYLQIDLWKNSKRKKMLLHKLVAQAFIPNPNNYSQINHKDENKINNNTNNLEWCTAKYNSNYGTRNNRISKQVICVELNKKFESIKMASELMNIQKSHISGCCKNKKSYKTAGGYHWRCI